MKKKRLEEIYVFHAIDEGVKFDNEKGFFKLKKVKKDE